MYPDSALLVRYEDLLCYPKEIMTRVCEFLSLNYEIELETPTKNGKLWLGNSMHGDKFLGISSAPIGRWQEGLSKKNLKLIEGYLGKTMKSEGYQLSARSQSVFCPTRHWLRQDIRSKRRIFGMFLRLYWPFESPKRINYIYRKSTVP